MYMERYQKKITRDFMTSYQGDDMGRKKREYSYDDWKKAMDLHNKYKLGYRQISRILGIKENTVNNWLYKGVVPPSAKWVAKPCTELAYIIGTVQGDGCITKIKPKNKSWYEYIVILATIDKEFTETFSRVMSKLLDVDYREPRWDEKQKKWTVKYDSKAFYTWYKKTEKQGLEGFKPYIEYNKETVKYYLRGLYDSDGNNYRNKLIQLYNSNKKLLEYVQYLLKKYFNVAATGPYILHKSGDIAIINGLESQYNQDYYKIQIGRKEHIQKYLKEIGFTITRKQLGLKKHEKISIKGKGV